MRFGIFADPHCGPRPDDGTRFFSRAPDKCARCLTLFAREQTAFSICLGDLYDGPPGPALDAVRRKMDALFARYGGAPWLCPGNHDVTAHTLPEGPQYRTFLQDGVQFILLDTNYGPDGVHYRAGTMQWDRLYAGEGQRRWLRHVLAEHTGPCLVFTHGNLEGRAAGSFAARHTLGDAGAVRRILQQSGRVQLVFQGHYHPGAWCVQDGITYVTLKALVDGPTAAPAALADCDGHVCRLRLYDAAAPDGIPVADIRLPL